MKSWDAYLRAFDIDPDTLRIGALPLFSGERGTERAIVLVHGLTDSPYYMQAVAERFEQAGYAVYLPLLDHHGLREPKMMRGASAERWKNNVRYAVETAHAVAETVSIGGLSTGGTLAAYETLRADTLVDGSLFLFAGALGVHHRLGPVDFGGVVEFLLRTPLADPFAFADEWFGRLIGANPYRYARVPLNGAVALAYLIGEVAALLAEPRHERVTRPVFAAHSLSDTSASVAAVEAFLARVPANRRLWFPIESSERVRHAEVVLDRPVIGPSGNVLEAANPHFDAMMAAALTFAERHALQ